MSAKQAINDILNVVYTLARKQRQNEIITLHNNYCDNELMTSSIFQTIENFSICIFSSEKSQIVKQILSSVIKIFSLHVRNRGYKLYSKNKLCMARIIVRS